jgi:hypothetical protein
MRSPQDPADLTALARECEVLVRAEAATELLARSSTLSRFDEEKLRRGLQLAQEAYRRLQTLTEENGGEVSGEVRQAMRSLARMTLRSYPVLLHARVQQRVRSVH